MRQEELNAIRERFAVLNTAILCDVFDELELDVPALDVSIKRQTAEVQKVAGWAYPIEGQLNAAKGPDVRKLEIVDSLPEGCVTVWSGTNATGICLFGDLIAATMQKRGCVGAVTDAGFRDVEEISATGFPVFANYVSPVQSVGRWRVTTHGEPVELAGAFSGPIVVERGDFVLGDEDGVVVVPASLVMQILERSEEIVRQEKEARELSKDGMTAAEMLEKYGHV